MATYEDIESHAIARMQGVGASEVSAIVGLNPWRRPIDIWEAKVHPEQVPALDSERLWFGNALEPVIRGRYAQVYGLEVVNPDRIIEYFPNGKVWNGQTIVTGRYPWMLATADGWIPLSADGLEIKNVGRKSSDLWGKDGTDEIPPYYICQSHWSIDVYDAKGWRVAPLFSGNELGNYYVPRDEEMMKALRESVRDFWETYVIPKKEPPVDGSINYGDFLARKFSLSTGTVLKNPPQEIIDWTAKMKLADDECKAAEDRKREANNNLRALIGDADKAITPLGTVGWIRPEKKNVTDYKAVTERLSALYEDARSANAITAADVVAEFTSEKQNEAYLRAWYKK